MMKPFKYVIFLLIFQGIFFPIYRSFHKKGFRIRKNSVRIAVVIAGSLANLSLESTEATKPSVS